MKNWYSIRAASGDEAEILIYDEIGRDFFGEGIAAEQFIKEIAQIKAATLNVRINSVGGQVFDGLAIFNALDRHAARVVTHVDGIAASIASVIALAGDEVRIAANAFLMIHNPHGIAFGDAADMRAMAETLEKVGGSLVDIYAKRTEKPEGEVRAWMDAETWFTAAEAKEAGFVDEITVAQEIKASFDLSKFAKVPKDLAARLQVVAPDKPAGPSLEVVQLAAASLRTLDRTRL